MPRTCLFLLWMLFRHSGVRQNDSSEQIMTAIFPHTAGKYGTKPLVSPVVKSLFYSILPSVPVIPLPTGPLEMLKYKFILFCFIQRIAILLAIREAMVIYLHFATLLVMHRLHYFDGTNVPSKNVSSSRNLPCSSNNASRC